MNDKIKPKERDAIIRSLKAGVTPKIGIQHIQVGRFNELKALSEDIVKITEGCSIFRLIIGSYGAGKTFFLSVVKAIALKKNLVTINADLSPDRRLHASAGQARNLYSEMMVNIATRSQPEGNALKGIIEKFIIEVRKEAESSAQKIPAIIANRLSALSELVGGYDFAKIIEAYWQ